MLATLQRRGGYGMHNYLMCYSYTMPTCRAPLWSSFLSYYIYRHKPHGHIWGGVAESHWSMGACIILCVQGTGQAEEATWSKCRWAIILSWWLSVLVWTSSQLIQGSQVRKIIEWATSHCVFARTGLGSAQWISFQRQPLNWHLNDFINALPKLLGTAKDQSIPLWLKPILCPNGDIVSQLD